MASIIKSDNGVSSGITGIVQSADSSGQLVLQTTTSGGTATTAVTIDNTQKVTFANAITPSTTNGIVGTTLGDNAVAGSVGEYVSSTVSAASSGLTTSTTTTVTSISLTAGDWDVIGAIAYNFGGGCTASSAYGAVSTGSSLPTSVNGGSTFIATTLTASTGLTLPVPSIRVNVTTTTTVNLIAYIAFTGGSCGAGGFIGARRRR